MELSIDTFDLDAFVDEVMANRRAAGDRRTPTR